MTKYLAWTVAATLAATMPAAAQSAFQPGQKVKSDYGNPAPACTTQEDLKNYQSNGALCAFGDPGGCAAVRDTETRKVCGPRSKSYAVISIDGASGLMQISPVQDKSKTYWAQQTDFKPAK